jgi:hypothetical protein
LPGEESFNEVGVQLSERLALPGDLALTISADWLQGDSFRIPRESSGAPNDPLDVDPAGDREAEPRAAGLGRISLFIPVGDQSGVEVGASGTHGTNNVAAHARTTVLGADVRAKLWSGPQSYLVLQGEFLALDRDEAGWDEPTGAYTLTSTTPVGGFAFADWNLSRRWNLGAGFESWQQPGAGEPTDTALRAFAGFALMEETTAFRLDWTRRQPGSPEGAPEPDAIQTVMLRVIFSMGPHKAHAF